MVAKGMLYNTVLYVFVLFIRISDILLDTVRMLPAAPRSYKLAAPRKDFFGQHLSREY